MPRVSVIVAARDAAATLPTTLASIGSQTYRDWEIVLVDDGSTDATPAIASGFEETLPLTLLRNEAARGPSAARNRAVEAAQGELIAILDADDGWVPSYLEDQVGAYDAAVARGERVGVVAGDAQLVGVDGEPLADTWADRVGRVEPGTLAHMLAENRICSPTVMPRGVFEALGGFDETLWRGEDYDLWLRLLEEGYTVVATDEPLAVVRFTPGGLMSSSVETAADTRRVYELALARGRLSASERRLARRQVRLLAAVEVRALIAAEREGRARHARRLRSAPLIARVALEHPERWLHWLRRGPRTAGSSRHA